MIRRPAPRVAARADSLRLVATLILIGSLLAACDGSRARAREDGTEPEGWVTIRGRRVAVELAITPAEQQLGLGQRDALARDTGMLFLYEKAGFYRYWMKDMRFDIDIVWIRDDRIVDISHRVPHVTGGTGPTVSPMELTDTVLEVPAGYAIAQGWQIGQPVEVELIRPRPR